MNLTETFQSLCHSGRRLTLPLSFDAPACWAFLSLRPALRFSCLPLRPLSELLVNRSKIHSHISQAVLPRFCHSVSLSSLHIYRSDFTYCSGFNVICMLTTSKSTFQVRSICESRAIGLPAARVWMNQRTPTAQHGSNTAHLRGPRWFLLT